ncbi:MAG: 1-acyl-sn-glycerol-3-phosphate acyltransferase [Acidimicrobiia bacterium]|nr:1-acyl-sn-glycerol-3-phosphate acyltransferase [Acidimicrobiia bacterium]
MTEPRLHRWRRRARTIPSMLVATAVALFLAPVAIPVLAVADLVRLRTSVPSVRVYLFALQYLVNDSVEILAAGPYWVLAGFGTRLRSPASIQRHRRLQQWSLDLLEQRAVQLLGLRVDLSPEDHAALAGERGSGPVIVISRHVSLFDASLPGIVTHRAGYVSRGIIMAELLADPGFDLLYGRLGSVFVPRDDGTTARQAIARMVTGATDNTAYILFPEGRLFRPEQLERSIDRLASSDPDRAKRLGGLSSALPPRPGGLLTLLEALSAADVVVLDHRGLDHHQGLADLLRSAPVREPITVTARRIPRAEIPSDPAAQTRWLDDVWLALDRDVSSSESIQLNRPVS